jgi:hypothetical protein
VSFLFDGRARAKFRNIELVDGAPSMASDISKDPGPLDSGNNAEHFPRP